MDPLDELRRQIARRAKRNAAATWIEGMAVFCADKGSEPLGSVSKPVLAIVAQGAKRSVLGDRVFDYHAGQYLVVTVDLPLTSQITQATVPEPFLAFSLPLQPAIIAQLLLEAGPAAVQSHDGPGIATSDADYDLLDAVARLLRLLDDPPGFRALASGVRREIHWRLMNGPQGALVRQIGLADSRLTLVAGAITWIQAHYDQVIRMDDLARHVGLSVSSLNRHFRAVTAMSPLRYQKQLRLQKARLLLISMPGDVAGIGHAVGYDSASQFSREYRRMFGTPPAQDAVRLQTVTAFGA